MPAATAACHPSCHSRHWVNAIPMATGNVLWKAIAPVMFPRASVSFFWRIHMTLLNFSGSSVAIGVMSREITRAGTPAAAERLVSWRTNRSAPKMMAAPVDLPRGSS